jgi:hypothetical protein
VQQQLELLNAEVKEVAVKLDEARQRLLANPDKPALLQVLNGLQAFG